MKITVVSPHRDDAAFSLGLAIGTWISAGHTVEVINCFTSSRYSPFGDVEFIQPIDLQSYVSSMRQREDIAWSQKYPKAVQLCDLNLLDAPQRLKCSVDEVCSTPFRPHDKAIVGIRSKLEQTVGDVLIVPLAIGDHVDHLTARIASQTDWKESLPIAFYEDLPYAARAGVAERIEQRAASMALQLKAAFVAPRTKIEDAVALKRHLALSYDSQIDTEVLNAIAGFCERYGGRERLWVTGAWRMKFGDWI